jgi:hypothetical protein
LQPISMEDDLFRERTMARHRHTASLAILVSFGSLIAFSVVGCGDSDEDGFTADELKQLGIPTASPITKEDDGRADSSGAIQTAFAELAPKGELKLTLAVGERFPIQKTIKQTLEQQGANGPVTTKSFLSMLFAIVVEAEEDGRKLMNVRYQRVRYEHEILGERVEYDSATIGSKPVPSQALVYHGLIDNGFSFWLGADNQVAEVIDFDEFLKRCVRHVPAAQREVQLNQIVATHEDEGFSNFVDNSIGLLPYDPKATACETAVKVGETWDAPKQLVMRPLPMQIDTKYTLTKLTDDHAHISVLGTISPTTAKPTGANASELITLTGGHTIGNCVIVRETGLPMKSNVEQRINMEVQIDAQRRFQQHKIIQTTVESFPADQAFLSGTSRTGAARSLNPPSITVDPQARRPASSVTSRSRRPLPREE